MGYPMKIFRNIQFASEFVAKKTAYFELLRTASQRELTPEWLKDRYGTVSSHALLVGSRLWLVIGVAHIIGLFTPETITGVVLPGQQRTAMVFDYNTENLVLDKEVWFKKNALGRVGELNKALIDARISADEWEEGVNAIYEQASSENLMGEPIFGQKHEWAFLSNELGDMYAYAGPEVVLSIVDPRFSEEESRSPEKDNGLSCMYPWDQENLKEVNLCELDSPIFERDGTSQSWFHEIDVLIEKNQSISGYYISPGKIRVHVSRGKSQKGDEKDWKLDSVELVELGALRRNAGFVYSKAGVEANAFTPFESYSGQIDSVANEVERIIQLPPPRPFVSKLIYVVTYVFASIICAFVMALLCVILGQKREERPLGEIFQICAHMLLSATGAFCALYLLAFNYVPVDRAAYQLYEAIWSDNLWGMFIPLTLLFAIFIPIFWLLRFFINPFALQVTAACRYPVVWEARSFMFGFRRAKSLPSIAFRVVAIGMFCFYVYQAMQLERFETSIELLLFQWDLF